MFQFVTLRRGAGILAFAVAHTAFFLVLAGLSLSSKAGLSLASRPYID